MKLAEILTATAFQCPAKSRKILTKRCRNAWTIHRRSKLCRWRS